MILQWQIDTPLEPGLLSLMQSAADCALRAEGIHLPCAVQIRLCSDEAIRIINRDHRQIDRSTDVLSFPTVSYRAGHTAATSETRLRQEWDDELQAVYLGDLIIAVPHIFEQAKDYGHSPAREAAYLLVHGLCHLMGYDHIQPDEQRRMRTMEEKILTSVGVVREGEGTVTDEMLLKLAEDAMTRSYSPYSHYPVGAALLCADGRVYQGCNIENAALGLTNCAERTAIFKAVSEGAKDFVAVAIAAKGVAPWPCGACRQVLHEFAPNIRVMVTWDGQTDERTLPQLLPFGFNL